MTLISTRHYFNNISYTIYPFYISSSVFCFIFFFLLYVNRYSIIDEYMICIPLLGIIWYTHGWIDDITVESIYWGRYNKKVRSSLVCGFLLFLVSEMMLFSGFFWSFFDRFFHLSYATFNSSMYYGFERLNWYKAPLKATIYLLTSGYMYNQVYYRLKSGFFISIEPSYELKISTWKGSFYTYNLFKGELTGELDYFFDLETAHSTGRYLKSGYTWTLFYAFLFLFMQAEEYSELMFTMADGVYCSLFFLLTGFHGMHVIMGTLFISISYDGFVKNHFSNTRHLGFGFSLVYWHFVDMIWIFLFMFVYMFNNWEFTYLISDYKAIYHGF